MCDHTNNFVPSREMVMIENSSGLSKSQKVAIFAAFIVAFALVVLRPLLLKAGPSGDFMTIFRQTRAFWEGESVYRGGNPYLPGIYVLMAYQVFLDPRTAWLIWRFLGIALVGTLAWILHPLLKRELGNWKGNLALANVLLLSGMSPWSGNPGNLAGIMIVLAYALMSATSPFMAGVILGLATALKYSLGLPFIVFALLGKRKRAGFVALSTFLIITMLGVMVAWAHGTSPDALLRSVAFGIQHVGGYEHSGFTRWFTSENPYRFQLTTIVPLLHSLGLSGSEANLCCLALLAMGVVLSLAIALRTGSFLSAAAVFSPFFLMCTYHRFYDTAILAFPVLLGWKTDDARAHWWLIVPSMTFFLSISNILQTRVLHAGFLSKSWLWNWVIGPHHWYALIVMSLSVSVLVLRKAGRMLARP
ncbi:MAG: glycosyltransferase family 87 protein [Thermogutta sp.]|jgi:hypothetical protein